MLILNPNQESAKIGNDEPIPIKITFEKKKNKLKYKKIKFDGILKNNLPRPSRI